MTDILKVILKLEMLTGPSSLHCYSVTIFDKNVHVIFHVIEQLLIL